MIGDNYLSPNIPPPKGAKTMYKTTWVIFDETENNARTEFVLYHFGKNPKFSSWYFEENHTYVVEMLWNHKLITTFKIFFKCLTNKYIIK